MRIMTVQTKYKFNAELLLNLFRIKLQRNWKQKSTTKKTRELEKWQSEILPEYRRQKGEGRLMAEWSECNKIISRVRLTELQQQEHNVHLMESLTG